MANKNNTNKVVIVTGGANGVGKEISRKFSQENYIVVIGDINETLGKETAKQIQGYFVLTDVRKPEDLEQLVKFAVLKFGRVDVMVNNAGIGGEVGKLADYSIEGYSKLISVNLNGVFYGTKFALKQMEKQKFGCIINISSISAIRPIDYCSIYSATKAAVISLTQSASNEYREMGIRVNAICPSYMKTDLLMGMVTSYQSAQQTTPKSDSSIKTMEFIKESDVSEVAFFLSSDSAKHISGQSIIIDRGLLSKM